jgi:hypothetical protein
MEWISVEERLPDVPWNVWAYSPPLRGGYGIQQASYKGNDIWREANPCDGREIKVPITHWMPLPDPPEEES